MSWRRNILDIVINDYNIFNKDELNEMSVYQFGVFNGGSMKEIASILSKHQITVDTFFGFDVFTGMPKETSEPIAQPSWDPDIEPDAFNVLKNMNLSSPSECALEIQNSVKDIFEKKKIATKVDVIAGLVEETVEANKEKYKKVFYVDFDLDIYSPTKYAFDFLMKNDLIQRGTIIGYDDWGGTPGYKEMKDGESRAHREIVEEYGIEMTKIFEVGNEFPHVQTVWIVDNLK